MKTEAKLIMISRLLTPANRDELMERVYLAYAAENSVRKSPGPGPAENGAFQMKPQGYTCRNKARRSKK